MRALRFCPLVAASCLCLTLTTGAPAPAAPGSLPDNVAALEIHFFHHDYKGQPLNTRLDRLDKLVFGSVRSGPAVQRTAYLLQAVESPSLPPPASPAGTARQRQLSRQPVVASKPVSNPPRPKPPVAPRPAPGAVEAAYSPAFPSIKTYGYGQRPPQTAYARKPEFATAQKGIRTWARAKTPPGRPTRVAQKAPPVAPGRRPGATRPGTVVSQVAMLEMKVFGHTSPQKPMLLRLSQLELAVCPQLIISPSEPIPVRIDRLKSMLAANQPVRPGRQLAQSRRPARGYAGGYGGQYGGNYGTAYDSGSPPARPWRAKLSHTLSKLKVTLRNWWNGY